MDKKELGLYYTIGTVIFLVVAYGISLLATTSKSLSDSYVAIFCAALCVNVVLVFWNYNKKIIASFAIFSVLYILAALTKLFANIVLSGKDIVGAFVLGNLLCCFLALLTRVSGNIKNKKVKIAVKWLLNTITVISFFIPFLFIGYYILSHQILSATIILTLFQTNLTETISYLKDNNIILWGAVLLITFLSVGSLTLFFNNVKDTTPENDILLYNKIAVLGVIIISPVVFYNACQALTECYLVNVFQQTKNVLKEYEDYGKAKRLRQHNLNNLKGLKIASGKGGLYILVIGESATRDHMHVYGYEKETTPWLSSIKNGKDKTGMVLFRNAYSNHTHTVPVLTYGLSAKNQYNTIDLSNAYSIIEVAKAAGYTTYWISNQIKVGGWDTPVAEIASTADHEMWLNGNVGFSLASQYYDEKIVEKLSELDIKSDSNVLIICHLMGSHIHYQDRYPSNFQKFNTNDKRIAFEKYISAYDNSVYYTDYVLKLIYEFASKQSNFKGMIYLSDHGEDPDTGSLHEASKFTWKMARIPLVMFFSEAFKKESYDMFSLLMKHKNKYWTNDLLYNVLVAIMHIDNAPLSDKKWNIASEEYMMGQENLKTLHGDKNLIEE